MHRKNGRNIRDISDLGAEFYKLFWVARKEHAKLKKKITGAEPGFRSAVNFAKTQEWSWAETLLEVSRLDCFGEHDKALSLLVECKSFVPSQSLPLFHFLRGSVLYNKGELDEAIKAYRKALDDPDPEYETPGNAWYNLGIVLSDKGELDEAIKAYRKALDDPEYETPGNAWNNLGNVLSNKGELDEAIKAYRKAIDDPEFETPGDAWNNLGITFSNKGELDEAIKAYRKAIDDPELKTPGNAWNNLGIAFSDKGDHDEAIKAYRKALASTEPKDQDHTQARFLLNILKSRIKPEALSPNDRAMIEKAPSIVSIDEFEGSIIEEIRNAGDTQYEKYLDQTNSTIENTLSILRGWSSAVTLLEGSERRWRGGGYFLKWRGYGIVIDPGFDFLRNFHDNGFHGREISVVVVSHNHPDHNSDLKDIDDLRYELFKRKGSTKKKGSHPYILLWDQDTSAATKFVIEQPEHYHEPIILTSGFPQPIDLRSHQEKIPVRLIPFKVNHGSDVPHAMGMVLELLDKKGECVVRIGYTGDTAYFKDLSVHLANCDLLIAHISQPTVEELRDSSKLKEVHLGYRGTIRLIRECKPKLTLLAEFWAGYADLRIPLVKSVRHRSGMNEVLPAGIGMHIKLPDLDIECNQCRRATPFTEVKVAPSAESFGNLSYLCPSCMIS